ncbi:prolyl 4-hydroxylase subunit alpha [Sneathiella sp. P13V-1]|uniref:2OG-Fe(II) oxygenase n=1 Tax=Sneathiella sp. P13V-1 TaxID=2697366 RepID=UPI00187B5B78|nr:2OG-Fe(II) oxygenase [Sneathiella sp. P13V-1]MBE7635468.1 prolyl 4-hydroxylase subunit alpha [Sneathiella sp. P13V-1]
MSELKDRIAVLDWQTVADDLNNKGYALVPEFLSPNECGALIEGFDQEEGYRKTVVMERHRFGKGSYKYWNYPLPDLVQELREGLYPNLVPVANSWMKWLGISDQFPKDLLSLSEQCQRAGQSKPTPLILKYGQGGYNTLHQDLYGEVYFPIQAACFLNEPGEDYTGGEFVLTEQVPRAQSKAMVLAPRRGDMIIFTTNFRPVLGTRGYYRAKIRHGVSEVKSGNRYTLGIIFHDATS